jgi:hypothetical protein
MSSDSRLPQGEFFFSDEPKKNDLVIKEADQGSLRPSQIAFNRALKRLRKAKDRLDETKERQEQFHKKFLSKVQPLIDQHSKVMLEWILAACDWCETPQTGVRDQDRQAFIDQILDCSENLAAHRGGITDEEFLRMEERVQRLVDDGDDGEDEAQIKSAMLEMIQEMLRAEGLDIDLSDIDPDDFAAIEARAEEAMEKAVGGSQPRKRTAKQIAAEENRKRIAREKEDAKLRDFKSLFKNLAKSMHPDLVTDPETKAHREHWMKRLTSAYENRDLHSLLTIEMEWLGSESKDLETAGDEKLAIYTELLREQALEAEYELRRLEFEDPTASFSRSGRGNRVSPEEIASQIRHEMEQATKETTILRTGGKKAKALVRELVRPVRRPW